MRVTHVITRLIIGGAQENTAATVLGLRKRPGMEINLIAGPTVGSEGSLESTLQNDPGLLTILKPLVRPVHPVNDLIALARLADIFRSTRPDIVHTHSGKAGTLGRLAARRAAVPIIIHTIHGPSFGPFQGPLANAVFLAAERRAGAVTTHFISVADAMTRQYVAAGIGRTEDYTRIFSGFELAPFLNARNDLQLRAKLGIQPDDIVIGKIARLFKLKGHEDLIATAPDVLKRVPKAKFLLVGDGSLRSMLESRVRAAGLEGRFIFAGLVTPREIAPLVGIMDIVAHLSLREGLPRALPQALAAGRPIIAYDCDGAEEVCMTDETGYLVNPGDTKTLAARLVQLAEDAALRERLGRRGQEFVRSRFSVETMVDEIHNLYRKLSGATAQ
ncbi:MAG TPA: glycosyltransferase family 4 protein [Verrucomicrobiae bacterium]|jgi:glycosyltransferase involved in cell wall biosynthesis